MGRISELEKIMRCDTSYRLAVNDSMNVVHGKWKLPIIASLISGKKRFKQMENEIPNINPRMLSQELKDLQANGIVSRKVCDTMPISVEYELTDAGHAFKTVLDAMIEWGLEHRRNNIKKLIKKI